MKYVKLMLMLALAVLLGRTALATTLDFNGCTVTVTGATVATKNGEMVLTFTQSGTLSVSSDVLADILVVGGGGGGGSAYYSSSTTKYSGNGGNGGEVKYVENQTLSANTVMSAVVGAAGAGGAAAGKKVTANSGADGGDSSFSISSSSTITAGKGTGGAGGSKQVNGKAGSAGSGAASYGISGQTVAYGSAGKAAGNSKATDVSTANGQGGQGGYRSSTQSNRAGGAGGAGVVIVRLKEVLIQREQIEKPTAATGLVYDGTLQTGVAPGAHYTLGGTYQAKNAGSYAATVTPASGYCWPDKSYGEVTLKWSIARRPVTVSVLPTGKTVGEEEPVYETKAEGFVDGDSTEAEVSWKVWRTGLVEQGDGSLVPNEAVGTYDLVVSGTEQTVNYAVTYVNGSGAFEIRPAVVEIAVPTAATGLVYDGKAKTGVAGGVGYVLSGTVTAMDAGAYSATATLLEGYCWAGGSADAKTVSWSIAKANYDMSGVVFQHKASVYNGQFQPMAVTGPLPDGVTVAYENNANKDAGFYTVTAKFTGDTQNHNPIGDLTADLAIEPAAATVTADDKAKTFGAADPALTATVTGLFGEDTVVYALSRAAGEAVGTYAITPTGASDQGNYYVTFVPGTLTVGKAKVAEDGSEPGTGTVPEGGLSKFDATATYDGLGHTLDVAALVDATASSLQKDGSLHIQYATDASGAAGVRALPETGWSDEAPCFTNAGEHVVWYRVTADNYEMYAHAAKVTISKLTGVTVTVVGNCATNTYDGESHTVSGYAIAADNALYDVTNAVKFTGTAAATRADAGTTKMELPASQFANVDGNFDEVSFNVTDGELVITKATVASGGEEPGTGTVPEGGLSKFDATATYDGLGHTIDVAALVDATASSRQKDGSLHIEYATDASGASGAGGARALPANAPDGSVWVNVAPSFTNAGEHVVWYRVTADNYETFAHAAQVTILPLAITVTPVAGQERTVGDGYVIAFTTDVALVGADAFTGELATADAVGEQSITRGTLAIDDGNGGENYMLTFDETVTIVVKSPPPSISDDKGQVDYNPATKEVVVTPDASVKDVEIVNMPSDATAQVPTSVDTVKGVTPEQVVVVAEATNETGTVKVDITDAFKIAETSAGVTIELDEDPAAEVVIEIGGEKETIKVTPELTETGDTTVEPLEVATEDVKLGVKTIPGLTYHLKRSTTLGGGAETVASETAKGTRTKLTDLMVGEKPRQAFYVIEVTK